MILRLFLIEDMDYLNAIGLKEVSDQAAMATPPKRFGTHHCRVPAARQLQKFCYSLLEFGAIQMICVGPERGVLPVGIL
jgi:hypothetical protein